MKRLIVFSLVLLLALCIVYCAAADSTTFTTSYFTLTLPADWEINMENLDDDPMEGFEYLGAFAAPDDMGIAAFASLIYYEDLTDISLWNSDSSTLQDYVDATMEDFADNNPEYLGTVNASSIPFILIRGTDEDGEFLYADTMTNGYAIAIEAFVLGPDGETQYPFTDEYLKQFKDILATFKPVA